MRMKYRTIAAMLLSAASVGAADLALAQAAEAPGGQEVTVTGRREALRQTLKSVLTETGFGQLGRFETRVCPGVTGFPQDYAAVLIGIIRANAAAAGATLQPEGCKPNAVVVFLPEPQDLVKGWQECDPSMFGTMTKAQVDALAGQPGPVLSWRVTETMAHDGTQPGRMQQFDGQPTREGALVIRNAIASRTSENVRQDINMSIVLIDKDAIKGKSLQQLGDLATLHLFLDISPEAAKKAGQGSILSLFEQRPEGAPIPASLSAFDRGMLKGLYAESKNNFTSRRQRGRVVRHIEQETAKND